MYNNVGTTFLAGFGVMCVMGLFNYFLGKVSVKTQKNFMKEKDKRIKITNEVFSQIKFIKVNSWEENFYEKLDAARELELFWIKRKYWITLGQILSSWATPVFVINATFAWYTLVGNSINAENAFIVISMFTVL